MTNGRPTIDWVLEAPPDPLSAYKREDGDWKAGVRPASVVETISDVEWALDTQHREAGRPQLVCGFCGTAGRPRTIAEGIKWFRGHACEYEGVPIEKWLAA